jgi:predicted transcriptional regulator
MNRSGSLKFTVSQKRDTLTSAFTVRLDDETLKSLDDLAARTERSRSWLAAKAIEEYVALNAWQLEKIAEGIAAADRGDFASDAEMKQLRKKYVGGK